MMKTINFLFRCLERSPFYSIVTTQMSLKLLQFILTQKALSYGLYKNNTLLIYLKPWKAKK